ncbi:MAG: hypothetical protein ABIJ25_06495, partial [Pseudomonadota bacterium]
SLKSPPPSRGRVRVGVISDCISGCNFPLPLIPSRKGRGKLTFDEVINIGGTATVIEAAIKEGVTRVVLFSTIAVYGPSV